MRGEQDLKEALIQNLEDAGCNNEQIKEFFKLYTKNKIDEVLILLTNHKQTLLKKLRKDQREIDDLDYLILDIKNNAGR